jgi:hypothetical protein
MQEPAMQPHPIAARKAHFAHEKYPTDWLRLGDRYAQAAGAAACCKS